MDDKDKVLSLHDGESTTINWFDGGGGFVTRCSDGYILEEIPQYGGMPISEEYFAKDDVDEMIALANTWT